MNTVISTRELTKVYDVGEVQVPALRGVSLDVAPGEFVALTGPSGSGKSTFMHLLGCLDRPTGGQFFLNGRDVSKLGSRDLARVRNTEIGFVFQGFNLLSRTSALENVELPLLYAGNIRAAPRHHRAAAQQQRDAIASALGNSPTLLLADEPTGNLDTKTSVEVMGIFQRLNMERGITIVLVTHEADIAEYGTRIITFRDGVVLNDSAIEHQRIA